MNISITICTCEHVRVPAFLQSADVAKHEIGQLITNTWPLILTFHFLSIPALSSYPSSLHFCSALSLSSTPSHFPSTHFLFSTVMFSALNSIFPICPFLSSQTLLSFFFFFFARLLHCQPQTLIVSFLFRLRTSQLQDNGAQTCCTINPILPPFSGVAFHSQESCKVA